MSHIYLNYSHCYGSKRVCNNASGFICVFCGCRICYEHNTLSRNTTAYAHETKADPNSTVCTYFIETLLPRYDVLYSCIDCWVGDL